MNSIAILKRFLPFIVGFFVGVAPLWIAGYRSGSSGELESAFTPPVPYSYGQASCKGRSEDLPPDAEPRNSSKLRIDSKPRPAYTDEARQSNVQGTVILRVTFLASGQIGSVQPVKTLPNGLTEQAVAAARRIKFEPAERDGRPVSVTKQIEYTFSIY